MQKLLEVLLDRGKGKGKKLVLSEVKRVKVNKEGEGFKSSLSPLQMPLSQILSVLVSLLVLSSTAALAGSGARTVYSQDAQGSIGIDLKIWKGYGLTINFIPTGEIIKQVWIGDPSRIAFTSNGNLCQKSNENSNDSNCSQGNATVLFLRQITPIKFANLTSSSDGNTQITIITSGSDGQKQYQFKLIPAKGSPSYTSLVIKPDSARPLPVVPVAIKPEVVPTTLVQGGRRQEAGGRRNNWERIQTSHASSRHLLYAGEPVHRSGSFMPRNLSTGLAPNCKRRIDGGDLNPRPVWSRQEAEGSFPPASCPLPPAFLDKIPTPATIPQPTAATINSILPGKALPRNDANALVYGLAIAHSNGQIKEGSITWKKAQDAIKLLRQGKSKEEAISRSGVKEEVFNQLIQWGQK